MVLGEKGEIKIELNTLALNSYRKMICYPDIVKRRQKGSLNVNREFRGKSMNIKIVDKDTTNTE
jgi:hypothetical protein